MALECFFALIRPRDQWKWLQKIKKIKFFIQGTASATTNQPNQLWFSQLGLIIKLFHVDQAFFTIMPPYQWSKPYVLHSITMIASSPPHFLNNYCCPWDQDFLVTVASPPWTSLTIWPLWLREAKGISWSQLEAHPPLNPWWSCVGYRFEWSNSEVHVLDTRDLLFHIVATQTVAC